MAPAKMHWTTKIGVAAVVLFMVVVAGLNALGWINTLPGPAGIAASVVAISFELMALVIWEHLTSYAKARDYFRFALASVGLLLAVGMNIEGGHRGLDHMAVSFHQQAETDRRAAQTALDAERANIASEIAAIQARIDLAAATNPGVASPMRMQQWRENFEALTVEDRRQIANLRQRLDTLPLTVAAQEPYPRWAPYAIASIFAFFSVFGLTMFSVKVPGPELSVAQAKSRPVASTRKMASGARKLNNAMARQALEPPATREEPAIIEAAATTPPCSEEALVVALDWLTGRGKVVSLKTVAGYLNVPLESVAESPHVHLVHEAIAFQKAQREMAA
jgi:hypothetical protein